VVGAAVVVGATVVVEAAVVDVDTTGWARSCPFSRAVLPLQATAEASTTENARTLIIVR